MNDDDKQITIPKELNPFDKNEEEKVYKKIKRTSVVLPLEVVDKLDHIAEREAQTISQLIRYGIHILIHLFETKNGRII